MNASSPAPSRDDIAGRTPHIPVRHKPKRYAGDDHRRAILSVAVEMFGRFGFEGASTRKIAVAAGIEQGHLVYYYPTKEALWRDAVETFSTGLKTSLSDGFDRSKNFEAVEQAKVVLPRFIDFCADNPLLTRMMLQEFSINSPRLEWLISSGGRPIWLTLKPLFDALHEKGLLCGAHPAVAYLNFLGAAALTFGNFDTTQQIIGTELDSSQWRHQQTALIMRTILSPGL